MKTKVVNIDTSAYDVYIGRASKWGNPFVIGTDGDRTKVIEKYKFYLLRNRELMRSLGELWGKRLGCHCKPLACHGDFLVEQVDNWSREAFRCAHVCDGFCDAQIVKMLSVAGLAINELELEVIKMKDQYPCLFKSNVLGNRLCKTCGYPETPHSFRHPFVPRDY